MRASTLSLSLLLGTLIAMEAPAATPARGEKASPVEFNRDIRPLFAKHCTACHGGVKAAGKISFLYRDKALAEGKSGEPAIVPGAPEKSEVIRRVLATDPDEVMPKPDHGPRLSEKEIATLRQWIKEGAPWSEHWSFVPPQEPPGPKLKNKSWAKVSADKFILTRLEAEGLKPSPEATPAEWLRRVSLDLTGLPPTLDDYQSFVKDRAKNPATAREWVVDRLLASPQFGERWASVWLDLARYSDTFGYEKDPHRDIWPWRDWVIRAFNADLPFDQFTIKQLAGDLLPSPTADDVLATAFHRNTQNNTEGGTDDEEFRTAAVLDRVSTTWTAWNATTFGCVQCHSHPYDPFPHRDFYRFAAFFNNTEDCDQNDDYPRLNFANDQAKRDEGVTLQRESRRLREKLNDDGLAVAAKVTDWQPLVPTAAKASAGQITVAPDGRINASGTLPVDVKYTLTIPAVPGMTAFKLDIFPASDNPKSPPERGQVLSKLTAMLVVPGASNQPVKLKEVIADYLSGPRDPQKVLDSGGGLGSYPVVTGPRWGIVVLEKPLAAPERATIQIVIEHGIASGAS
jgi:mono/diheme cytochrome c family protein